MPAGRIEIKHNFTGLADFLIVRWFKSTAPASPASGLVDGSTVTQVVYPSPHGEKSLVITEIDPEFYTVRFYQSADGATPDAELPVPLSIDASQAAMNILTTYNYIVGRGEEGDPVDGDTGLRDARLLNKNYSVYERGTGPMIDPEDPSAEWVDRSDDGGGFDWVTDGKVFNEGAVYTVVVQNQQDIPDGGGGGSDYNDIVLIDADTTFDVATHAGKVLLATDGVIRTLTMPLLASLGDCKFRLMHYGNQTNTVLQLGMGNTVAFRANSVNKIILGKGEWVECLIKNNVLYVTSWQTQHELLGSIRWLWENTVEQNTLVATDSTGSQLNESDYARVTEILDTLPAGSIVSLASWSANKGKWGRGSGKFIVPYLVDQFIRAVATDMGRLQVAQTPPLVILASQLSITDAGATDTKLTAGGDSSPANPITINPGSTENRPQNIGLAPHICI